MKHDSRVDDVPAEIVGDVAEAIGTKAIRLSRLPGGVNSGAMRVRLGDGDDAVLKVVPRTHPQLLDETLRAQRIVEHMRDHGYPTPLWLGVGATNTHVWHLTSFVDGRPVRAMTPAIVDQLMEIVELQSGQATEPYDHSLYAWRVATGQEASVLRSSAYSRAAANLIERLRVIAPDRAAAPPSSDMVHADLNPSNVLVRAGVVVAIVDIENAGSGTRATDLTTLRWHTDHDSLKDSRARLWTRVLDIVDWEHAAVLATTQILLQLEWRVGLGGRKEIAQVIERGGRTLDELLALR